MVIQMADTYEVEDKKKTATELKKRYAISYIDKEQIPQWEIADTAQPETVLIKKWELLKAGATHILIYKEIEMGISIR